MLSSVLQLQARTAQRPRQAPLGRWRAPQQSPRCRASSSRGWAAASTSSRPARQAVHLNRDCQAVLQTLSK